MRAPRPVLPAAALTAFALAAAGCAGSAQSTVPVATNEVSMAKSYRFDPQAITVSAGETVVWTNDDNFTHTVQVEGQRDHEAEPGERIEIRFDRRGTFEYVCTLHSQDMDGTVRVE